MALTDESGSNMVLPVQPMGNNGGFGGDWGSWIILFLIFGMFGGWGNGGYGNGGFNNGLSYDFPWLLNANNNTDAIVSNGFQNAAVQNALTGIQSSITSGFGDVQLGFAGVNQNICQTGNAINNTITQGQITALQTANSLSSQLANCCCENRLATAQTQALVQSENCADRAALSDGFRDIIANQTANTQAILDKLCQQEIDNLKTANSNLQTQVLMRDLAASQNAQTAALTADNAAQTQYIVNRVAPYPSPAYIVANPNTGCCGNTCGCAGAF
jgi:hypothetical protein